MRQINVSFGAYVIEYPFKGNAEEKNSHLKEK